MMPWSTVAIQCLIWSIVLVAVFVYGAVKTIRFRAANPHATLNRGRLLMFAVIPLILGRLLELPIALMYPAAIPTLRTFLMPVEGAYRIGLVLLLVAVPLTIVDEIRRRRRLALLRTQLNHTTIDPDTWPPPPSTRSQ